MNQRQIKKLMTEVAKGEITMEEAKNQMKPKTLKLNKKGGKKSHKITLAEQSQ